MEPFGFIRKTKLIEPPEARDCNNPFYMSPAVTGGRCVGVGCNSDLCRPTRSAFGNHAFVRLGTAIFDACAGPHLGTENLATYITNAIDGSLMGDAACEKAAAGGAANVCDKSRIVLVK